MSSREVSKMARYLGTIDVTTEGFRGMVSSPENRQEANAALFRSLGYELEHYWYGVGGSTIYVVYSSETDDDVNGQSLIMAVCASGIVNKMTSVRIIDAEAGKAAAEKSATILYRPPGG
jgi:uncharacterized protein with GYD domain|tara:strand:- start:60 stop:416 length:357 start_codon:yes stop_codon:yes gene_type:complete